MARRERAARSAGLASLTAAGEQGPVSILFLKQVCYEAIRQAARARMTIRLARPRQVDLFGTRGIWPKNMTRVLSGRRRGDVSGAPKGKDARGTRIDMPPDALVRSIAWVNPRGRILAYESNGLRTSSHEPKLAVTWCPETSSLTAAVPRRILTGFLSDMGSDANRVSSDNVQTRLDVGKALNGRTPANSPPRINTTS